MLVVIWNYICDVRTYESQIRDKVSARFYKIPSSPLRSFYDFNAVLWHRALCITVDMDRCCTEICCIHRHGTCVHTASLSIIIFILTCMIIMFVKFRLLRHIILKMTFVLPSTTTTNFISPVNTSYMFRSLLTTFQ